MNRRTYPSDTLVAKWATQLGRAPQDHREGGTSNYHYTTHSRSRYQPFFTPPTRGHGMPSYPIFRTLDDLQAWAAQRPDMHIINVYDWRRRRYIDWHAA